MTTGWWRRVGQVLLATLVAGGVLVAALAWRLSRGPIVLDALTPYLERALAGPAGARSVTIAGTSVLWQPGRHQVEVRLRDVHIVGSSSESTVVFPDVSVRLNPWALLYRRVELTSIDVVRPSLLLERASDGGLEVAVGDRPGAETGGAVLRTLAAALIDVVPPDSPLAHLRHVAVSDATVQLVDPAAGEGWRLAGMYLRLDQDGGGVAVNLDGRVEVGATSVPAHAAGRTRRAPAGADLTVTFEGLVPAAFAPHLGRGVAAGLARLALPLGGTVSVALDDSLRPTRVALDLRGGGGTLALPELPAGEVGVERLRLVGAWEPATDALQVDDLEVVLGASTVRLRGRVATLSVALTAEIDATVTGLATDALARYWPSATAAKARAWVLTHVSGGQVRTATAHAAVRFGGDTLEPVVESLDGTLVYDGLAVRYADGMPPVTAVAGEGRFGRDAWSFRVARGAIAGLDLVRAQVDVTGVGTKPRLAVDANVRGGLAAALALLDAKPLGYAGALGVAPAEAAGTVTARVSLGTPLPASVDPSRLGLAVSADVRGAALRRLVRGWSVSDGDLTVDLRGQALEVRGTARVEGTPVTLAWRETFAALRSASRRIDVRGRVDAEGRAALGVDLRPWLDGPVDAEVHLTQPRGGSGTVVLTLGLVKATIDLPVLGLVKPSGTPGHLRTNLLLTGTALTAVDALTLEAGSVRVTGRATRSADGRTWRTIDVHTIIAATAPGAPPAQITLAVRPAAAGSHFKLTTNDAGEVEHALAPRSEMQGGRVAFEGTADLEVEGLPFAGHLEVRDTRVTKAPVLARIASLASFSGITSQMSGGGIELRRLTADINRRGPVLTMTNGAVTSPSFEVLFGGTFDYAADTIAMTGTVALSYDYAKKALGWVPVVGRVFNGGAESGLSSVDFTVRGSAAAPEVSVDPVSAVTPRVLRALVRKIMR